MSIAPKISIVVPVYNEAARLPATLAQLAKYLASLERSFEVWVIVEKSTDGTLEIAAEFARQQAHFHVVDNLVQRGKGYAVRTGMLKARGSYVFFTDADLSVPPEYFAHFLTYFAAHPEIDILIGSRQHLQSQITCAQNPLRQTMGQLFNLLLHAVAASHFRDTQCGFKAFRHAAAQAIFSRQKLDGFAFDVEVLLLAERLGFSVEERPVEWKNSAASKVHIVRDSWQMLRDSLAVRRVVEETCRLEKKNFD